MTAPLHTAADVDAFFEYATSHGGKIEIGNIWDEPNGWRTYLRVGDRTIAFAPGWGRGFARRSREYASRVFNLAHYSEVLGFFDDLEAQCKETMRMRQSGAKPDDVTAETRGTA